MLAAVRLTINKPFQNSLKREGRSDTRERRSVETHAHSRRHRTKKQRKTSSCKDAKTAPFLISSTCEINTILTRLNSCKTTTRGEATFGLRLERQLFRGVDVDSQQEADLCIYNTLSSVYKLKVATFVGSGQRPAKHVSLFSCCSMSLFLGAQQLVKCTCNSNDCSVRSHHTNHKQATPSA